MNPDSFWSWLHFFLQFFHELIDAILLLFSIGKIFKFLIDLFVIVLYFQVPFPKYKNIYTISSSLLGSIAVWS